MDCGVDLLRNATIATETVPPGLTVAIEDRPLGSSNFDVGASDFDERVVRVKVLPEGSALEGNLGTGLELGQINSRVSRHCDAIKGDGSASRSGSRYS